MVILAHDILEGQDVNIVVARHILLEAGKDRRCRDITHVHWEAIAEG